MFFTALSKSSKVRSCELWIRGVICDIGFALRKIDMALWCKYYTMHICTWIGLWEAHIKRMNMYMCALRLFKCCITFFSDFLVGLKDIVLIEIVACID